MVRLSRWFRKSTERLTEVLLGADLQSRLCAYIDMLCAQQTDGILPTRFRIEMNQVLFDQKLKEYHEQTGRNLEELEGELARTARDHILGKGRTYRTYADTVTVRLEPHVMTRGVKIIADFPKEKAMPTVLDADASARKEHPEDARLPSVAKPVSTTFDGRSLETVVYTPARPAAMETRLFEPQEERKPSPSASMETRLVEQPADEQRDMETEVCKPPDDEMATRMEEPVAPTRILYRLALVEPEEGEEYSETESWLLEVGRAYTIGRSGTSDIVVSVGTVSRHHAELEVRPDGTVTLWDLGSRHGTYLNGKRVEKPLQVNVGDDIQLTQRGAAHLALRPVEL